MRGMGRTWEEIREYFVKELKYDEDTVVYYLDKKKEQDKAPSAPKPSEDLIPPEVHEELVDEILDEKPKKEPEPKLEAPCLEEKEIEKKDVPVKKEPEIANKLTTEIEKKADEPLETIPGQTPGTSKEMYPKTEFEHQKTDTDQITDAPAEIGDMPDVDIEDHFEPKEHVYVMGDYEKGTKGYEGVFVSEYTSDGEDYAIIDVGMNEMKEVPKRFVKKATIGESFKKYAEELAHKKELIRAKKAVSLVKSDILDTMNKVLSELDKEADPVMQPATEPVETPVEQEVPTKYRELKISPKDTKTKDVELADAKAQKAYESFLTSKQKLDNIEAKIAEVKRAADAQIKQIREEEKEQKEQKLFQSAVERMAKLVEATKDKVMRIGDMLFTYVKETKQVKPTMTDKEKLTKLYGYFTGAEEYIKKLEAEAETAVKEVTKKELIKSPYRESSIVKKQAGIQETLESLWEGLKKLYNISDKMEELASTASQDTSMEKKAQPMDGEQAKAELADAMKAEIEMGEIDHKGGTFTADGVEHRFFWSEDEAEQEAISQVRQDLDLNQKFLIKIG